MTYQKIKSLGAAVLATAVLGAWIVGCGGGSTAPDPVNTNDPGNNGIVGGVDLGEISVGLPQSGWPDGSVPGASADAPLGVNTFYNPVIAGAEFTKTSSTSRSASELAPGDDMAFVAATVAPFGQAPDYNAALPQLVEGELATIWCQFEWSGQAPGAAVSWSCDATGLDYKLNFVRLSEGGLWEGKISVPVPIGSAGQTSFVITLDYGKSISVVIGPNLDGPDDIEVPVEIIPIDPPDEYTFDPPSETPDGDYPNCMAIINVEWSEDDESVTVVSDQELSNVVLQFEDFSTQKFDDLDVDPRYVETFSGVGEFAGMRLRGVYVKSGCNNDFWGEETGGNGEYFSNNITGHAMMVWEDKILNAEYDYNDFVGSVDFKEYRMSNSGDLTEIIMVVQALARGAGYDHDWQFNIESAFPDVHCVATIDQFYEDGTRHGNQRIWASQSGVSIPVFISTKQALPPPPGFWATNTFDSQPVVDGDYAVVRIQFSQTLPQGNYTPMPYEPELRVKPVGGNTYVVPMWTKPGDQLDENGYPLAFVVFNTYAWPVEGGNIHSVYPQFSSFLDWARGGQEPNVKFFDYAPQGDWFDQSYNLIENVEYITF